MLQGTDNNCGLNVQQKKIDFYTMYNRPQRHTDLHRLGISGSTRKGRMLLYEEEAVRAITKNKVADRSPSRLPDTMPSFRILLTSGSGGWREGLWM